jgi:hypothetical protein
MSGVLEIPGFPKPTSCQITTNHVPTAVRFVLHHIQPQEAGGPTVAENLANVCDNCHYTVHRIMFAMRCLYMNIPLTDEQKQLMAHPPRRAQYLLAEQGYLACKTAGTVDQIPNEG